MHRLAALAGRRIGAWCIFDQVLPMQVDRPVIGHLTAATGHGPGLAQLHAVQAVAVLVRCTCLLVHARNEIACIVVAERNGVAVADLTVLDDVVDARGVISLGDDFTECVVFHVLGAVVF